MRSTAIPTSSISTGTSGTSCVLPSSKSPHDPYAPGLHHLCFRVEDAAAVDDSGQKLRAAGIDASQPRLYPEYAPDYHATFFSDPDGLRLEVTNYRAERRQRRTTTWGQAWPEASDRCVRNLTSRADGSRLEPSRGFSVNMPRRWRESPQRPYPEEDCPLRPHAARDASSDALDSKAATGRFSGFAPSSAAEKSSRSTAALRCVSSRPRVSARSIRPHSGPACSCPCAGRVPASDRA